MRSPSGKKKATKLELKTDTSAVNYTLVPIAFKLNLRLHSPMKSTLALAVETFR